LRFEFNQTGQAFDDGGLTDAGLANQHRRVGALAMAKNFDNLLNLFFAPDGRRDFVHARHAIQRDPEVFQVRRQIKLFTVLFVLLLAHVYTCAYVLANRFRLGAQILEHLDK